eukprot:Skav206106  [mRNA]  locus=scaffold3597:101677:115487:+ [translate_table: standard]
MVTISVASDLSPAHQTRPNLRLLCLHGHGGTPAGLCGNLEVFFQSILSAKGPEVCDPKTDILAIECRCVPGILPESRRVGGRQWWRYDEDGRGDRPADWAEMELATTKLAEELWTAQEADLPFDGILGFSQGAEMVHTIALLKHQGDPRFQGLSTPRFVVSFSGAINPAHFESISGGGPPRDCPGPYFGPKTGEVSMPCLFVGDFVSDGWYSWERFSRTKDLYADRMVDMPNHGLQPDDVTYSTVIHACGSAQEPQRADNWMKAMLSALYSKGDRPSSFCYNSVAQAWVRGGDVDRAIYWLSEAEGLGIEVSLASLNSVVSALTRARRHSEAETWSGKVHRNSIAPSSRKPPLFELGLSGPKSHGAVLGD